MDNYNKVSQIFSVILHNEPVSNDIILKTLKIFQWFLKSTRKSF